ncbi:hypothetical protein ACFE04_024023 [Oxalis oulophora]
MGDDIFDALLRQEGTSPASVMSTGPFVDAVVESPRNINTRRTSYENGPPRSDSKVPKLNRTPVNSKSPAVSRQESQQLRNKGSPKSMSSGQPFQAIYNSSPLFSIAAQPLGLPTQPRVSSMPKNEAQPLGLPTQPRVLPMPKNNNVQYCWLVLDSKDVFVAMAIYHGMMRKGESLHNVAVGEGKAKVSVVSIGERCETCPLMIPTTEIPTLQNAISSFIAWPKEFISMKPKVSEFSFCYS